MGAMRLCFLLVCLFLMSVFSVKPVSSVARLCSIEDLRNTHYADSAPRHGRQLLFWFAQQVYFDQNNIMCLNSNLNLNLPEAGDFGFHFYGNREGDLPSLNSRESYYSVGNLKYCEGQKRGQIFLLLPNYVCKHFNKNKEDIETNMDRLMIVLNKYTLNRIFRVYVTAHNRNRNDFNSDDTYEIDPALIIEIQTKCHDDVDVDSRNTEEKRCMTFLKETNYNHLNCEYRDKRSLYSWCYTDEKIKLEIKTTTQGYAKVIWDNVPVYLIENYPGNGHLYIDICQNSYSSDTNKDSKRDRKQYFNIDKSSGALDTFVLLTAGLQLQLRLERSYSNNVLWYGQEFDGANEVLPIRIRGNDASLQLCAKDGKACARLFIKKTFSKWQEPFSSSWVGFYKSSLKENNEYSTYQNAYMFASIENIADYNVYQYDSSLPIAPGVQIRFLLENNYVLAQTTPWEMDNESSCSKRKSLPELPSSWSFPEFFYEPEFYDANNIVPVKIKGYDAGLQLFTKEGKACARLYVKKTFTDWKEETAFLYSWVGFYTSSQNQNNGYKIFQYAVYFEKREDGMDNFDIYQYKSNLVIAPGVQIRFFLKKWYDYKLAETEPWKSG